MIAIVNHGLGNFRSVISAVESLKKDVVITDRPEDIKRSSKIIIPGVGSFKYAMQNLKKLNLIETLNEQVLVKKKPVLGICLGCQLLLNCSEENKNIKGFGWINGEVKKFKNLKKLPSTHVGWNEIIRKDDPIFENLPKKFFMYFNHSYFPVLKEKNCDIGKTNYSNKFVSIFKKENIYGIQPHPEKSQKFGIIFLENFIKNDI
jgi:imidazole glycerol-phosphate synthase subunit HisH